MGVQLNIKDAATVKLARELAEACGVSITQAVRTALQEAVTARQTDARSVDVDALLATARSLGDHWKPEYRNQELSITHGDLVHDEGGAPR